ncbi:MAG TPA: sensor domain-containing protein [Jiangellaceae bacterium]|nr:sensor domain-containing protein [Jiangellaceae bacterium]
MSEITAAHGPSPLRLYRRAAQDSAFLLTSFPLAIASFVLFVVGFSTSAALLVTFLGLPLMALTLTGANTLGNIDRIRFAAIDRSVSPARTFETDKTGLGRMFARLRHGQSWLDLLYALFRFPLTVATFVVTVTWWATSVGSILYVLWEPFLPNDEQSGLAGLLGFPGRLADVVLTTAVGVVMLVLLPWVIRAMVLLHQGLANATLGATNAATLRERVEALTSSRSAVVDAEATTLRRIERDIHDGPQQRLVRMSMDLRAAQRRMEAEDSDSARALVGDAVDQVQESLAELRALSRGIAPPVLADRGLHAALTSAAGQSPLPVELDIALEPGERLEAHRENAAYFVVTEALANAAKHSKASTVSVSVVPVDDVLYVQVSDDGVGGAHLGKGHGLSGLADRLSGVDGRMDLHSPAGGGTVVNAEIP